MEIVLYSIFMMLILLSYGCLEHLFSYIKVYLCVMCVDLVVEWSGSSGLVLNTTLSLLLFPLFIKTHAKLIVHTFWGRIE